MFRKRLYLVAVAVVILSAVTQYARAARVDGIWSSSAANPGSWSTTTNWVNGTVAGDIDSIADFNSVDVPSGGITVIPDASPLHTGNLIFGDTDTSTPGGWIISDGGVGGFLQLDVASGSLPYITVNALGGSSVVQFNTELYSVQGLNKQGSGTLVLNSSATTLLGNFIVNAGTLKLAACDNMIVPVTLTITVNGTLDLGGYSQTIQGYYSVGTTPVINSCGIVLNGTVQNGTLIDASANPSGGLFNFDARSGLVTADLSENLPTYGSAGLTKSTGGTLTLSGNNTYTGGTIVSAGTLVFNTLSSIPATGSMTVNGGVLQFNTASLPLPAGCITDNSGGAVAVTGPYATSNAWLSSGKIVNTAAGALALLQNEGNINMASGSGYANMSLGAAGSVTYTGTLTPMNNTYRLGGGGGTLILSLPNSLTNNGVTPRSVEINGPGIVNLANNNNYTGGTTINSGGYLRIGNINSIGEPASTLNFHGGQLEINSNGLSIDGNNVNWSTFNGGFTVNPGVTFSINRNIPNALLLEKNGFGTMNIGGTYNVVDDGGYVPDPTHPSGLATNNTGFVNLNYGTINILPGATLDASRGFNLVNGGGRGHVIIGQSGSSATTLMNVSAGTAGDPNYSGYMKLGGGNGGNSLIDIYGNNTTLQTTMGENFISMGEWGNATSTINVHDSAAINTGALYIAKWNYTKGLVNLYDNAKIIASGIDSGSDYETYVSVCVGRQGYGGATLNMYNNSQIIAANTVYVSEWGSIKAVANMYDNSTVTAGEIRVSNDHDWQFGVGIFNATANSRVYTSTAGGTTGNLDVGVLGNALGYLNIQDTAQVSVASQVIIGYSDGASGQINVSGSGQLTAAEIDVSLADNGATRFRQLNISGNGRVISAASGSYFGDLNQGASGVFTPGNINVSDNGYLEVGGNHKITYGTLTISSTTGNPQVKVFGDLQMGDTPTASIGTIVLGGNGTLKIGNTTTGTGNLYLVNGTLNTLAVSDAAGADGRVQLVGASSAIVFNGGTISPTASNASFMPASIPAAYIAPGGAIFNTAGFNITVAKGLADSTTLGGGGLTKQGSGTLTLTGPNTYSGGTTVAAGILEFNTAASIPATGSIAVNGGVLRFTSPAAIPPAGSINVNPGVLSKSTFPILTTR